LTHFFYLENIPENIFVSDSNTSVSSISLALFPLTPFLTFFPFFAVEGVYFYYDECVFPSPPAVFGFY